MVPVGSRMPVVRVCNVPVGSRMPVVRACNGASRK